MPISLGEFNLTCKLTSLRQKLFLNFNSISSLESISKDIKELILASDFVSKEFKQDLDCNLKDIEILLTDIEELKDASSVHIIDRLGCILDTHFVYLDTHGSETERVAWLQNSINSFLQTFEHTTIEDTKSPNFNYFVSDCKGDIEVTYCDEFTDEMRSAVTNYPEFLTKVKELGLDNSVDTFKTSNLFG